MEAILSFLGYTVVTLFLVSVCIGLMVLIVAILVMGAIGIRSIYLEWRDSDGEID